MSLAAGWLSGAAAAHQFCFLHFSDVKNDESRNEGEVKERGGPSPVLKVRAYFLFSTLSAYSPRAVARTNESTHRSVAVRVCRRCPLLVSRSLGTWHGCLSKRRGPDGHGQRADYWRRCYTWSNDIRDWRDRRQARMTASHPREAPLLAGLDAGVKEG
ncbi:hypothetical protein F5883DRAFT_532730 [Diaporthe sp. PMI_573]|nr:hypothetical protein F5883DRAFT_532730 [Diaporthaceae sp. PMI_573]